MTSNPDMTSNTKAKPEYSYSSKNIHSLLQTISKSFHYISTQIAQIIILSVWLGANVYLFVANYNKYDQPEWFYTKEILGDALPMARASAACLNLNCSLVLLPVCKHSLETMRRILSRSRKLHKITDEAIHFHKLVAYSILFWTLIHYYAHIFNVERYNLALLVPNSPEQDFPGQNASELAHLLSVATNLNPLTTYTDMPVISVYSLVGGFTGIIASTSFLVIFVSSMEYIRRHFFEVFWFSHHMFVVFFGALVVHGLGKQVKRLDNYGCDENNDQNCDTCHCPYKNTTILSETGNKPFKNAQDLENCFNDANCNDPVFAGTELTTWKWLIGPILLYTFERLIRFVNIFRTVEVIRVVEHPSNVMQLDMRKMNVLSKFFGKNPRFTRGQVGQYISVNVPEVSMMEWHPFTLTSAPESDLLSVYIRCYGDWTKAVQKYLKKCGTDHVEPVVSIDGPFGACSQDIFLYETALCIGMGIGITPFASLLNSLKCKLQVHNDEIISRLKLRNVYFCWSAKTTVEFEWFMDIMRELETFLTEYNSRCEKSAVFNFKYQLYITGDMSINDISHIVLHEEASFDAITNLKAKTNYKRPMWSKVFSGINDEAPEGAVGVFYCGTPLAMAAIQAECGKQTVGSRKFEFHRENF